MATSPDTPTSRLELICGREGMERLARSFVVVLGIGGVGSNCAESLARGGVGALALVDADVVEPSNINRQAMAFTSTLGRPKVEAMAEMIADINPAARLTPIRARLTPDNIADVLAGLPSRPDYVVDAIDSVPAKLACALWCQERDIPLVSSMGGANKLHPELLRFADISETHTDPLARSVRKEARRLGVHRLKVLYSPEVPVELQTPSGAETSRLGTMSYFPPIMGQMIAGEVIRELLGIGGDER